MRIRYGPLTRAVFNYFYPRVRKELKEQGYL